MSPTPSALAPKGVRRPITAMVFDNLCTVTFLQIDSPALRPGPQPHSNSPGKFSLNVGLDQSLGNLDAIQRGTFSYIIRYNPEIKPPRM